jgi:hypothetical protein
MSYEVRSTSVMGLVDPGVAAVALDTVSMSASTYYTKAATLLPSTHVFTFWTCASGTCAPGASGTATAETYSATTATIGIANSTSYFSGVIGAIFYSNTASVSLFTVQVAHTSQCYFGI